MLGVKLRIYINSEYKYVIIRFEVAVEARVVAVKASDQNFFLYCT